MASSISSAFSTICSKTCVGTKALGWTLASLPLSGLFFLSKQSDRLYRPALGCIVAGTTLTSLVAVKRINIRQLRGLYRHDAIIQSTECAGFIPQFSKLALMALATTSVSYEILGFMNGDNVENFYKDPGFYFITIMGSAVSLAWSGTCSAVVGISQMFEVSLFERELNQRLENLADTPPPEEEIDGQSVSEV